MVRTYWLVPGFYEASDNLDLQPFARSDQVETCHPRAFGANCFVSLLRQGGFFNASRELKGPNG